MRACAAVAASVVVILLNVGCGGGNDGDDATAVAGAGGKGGEVPAAVVRRLNAICLALNKKAGSEILELYDNPKVKRSFGASEAISLEATLFYPILLADAEAQRRAFEGLGLLPGADGRPLNRILAGYRVWIDTVRRTPRRAVVANDVYNEARELNGRYGLTECAENPFNALAE